MPQTLHSLLLNRAHKLQTRALRRFYREKRRGDDELRFSLFTFQGLEGRSTTQKRGKMKAKSLPTRVNQPSIGGYPNPSISSRTAFNWTLQKIFRSNVAGFKHLFLHVQVPDEDRFDDMDNIYTPIPPT